MRMICWTFVALSFSVLTARDLGGRAQYVGGTARQLDIGTQGNLVTTSQTSLRFFMNKRAFELPYGKINLIEYGQKADRRIVLAVAISPLLMLSKSRKHFVTLGYVDDSGMQQAVVFRVDKKDLRSILAGLEARTGLRVQFQDDEARKAGR